MADLDLEPGRGCLVEAAFLLLQFADGAAQVLSRPVAIVRDDLHQGGLPVGLVRCLDVAALVRDMVGRSFADHEAAL